MPPYAIIEGMDGSGKSTVAAEVHRRLAARLSACALFRFPGDTQPGKLIREVLRGEHLNVAATSLLWLYIADGAQQEAALRMKLAANIPVVADRHPIISARVYQTRHHTRAEVDMALLAARFVPPTHLFLLDVTPATVRARRAARNIPRAVLFEEDELAEINQVRQRYLALTQESFTFDHRPMEVLDGEKSVDELVDHIVRVLSAAAEEA